MKASLRNFFLAINDSSDDGKHFVGFYVAGLAVCDRSIAFLILQIGEMEPCNEDPGTNHC